MRRFQCGVLLHGPACRRHLEPAHSAAGRCVSIPPFHPGLPRPRSRLMSVPSLLVSSPAVADNPDACDAGATPKPRTTCSSRSWSASSTRQVPCPYLAECQSALPSTLSPHHSRVSPCPVTAPPPPALPVHCASPQLLPASLPAGKPLTVGGLHESRRGSRSAPGPRKCRACACARLSARRPRTCVCARLSACRPCACACARLSARRPRRSSRRPCLMHSTS